MDNQSTRYVKANMMYHFPDEPEREFKFDFNAYVNQDKENEELKIAARAILKHIGWPEAVVNDIKYEDAPEPEPVPGHDFSANFDDEDYHDFEVVE